MDHRFLKISAFLIALAFGNLAIAQTQQLQLAQPQTKNAILKLQFFHKEKPIKASIIIANADTRLEFNDVTMLETTAPRKATWTISADVDGKGQVTFKDVIPSYELKSSTANLEVHFPSDEVEGYAPMLLIKEAGAEFSVMSRTSAEPRRGQAFDLTTLVRGPAGSRFILDTILSTGGAANTHLCEAPCLHTFPAPAQGIDCSFHCYTCSTTAELQGNVWKENFNMCEVAAPTGGGGGGVSDEEDGVFEVTSSFQALPQGDGGIVLGVALRNDAALFPLQTKLRRIDLSESHVLAPPFEQRSYPDFVVPSGRYVYSVTLPGAAPATAPFTFSIPVAVPDERIATLSLNLPARKDLKIGEAYNLGDTRLGLALKTVRLQKSSSRRYRLTTELDDARDDNGWVAIALPKGSKKIRVRHTVRGGKGALLEGRDFVVSATQDATVLTLSVEPGHARYAITLN